MEPHFAVQKINSLFRIFVSQNVILLYKQQDRILRLPLPQKWHLKFFFDPRCHVAFHDALLLFDAKHILGSLLSDHISYILRMTQSGIGKFQFFCVWEIPALHLKIQFVL